MSRPSSRPTTPSRLRNSITAADLAEKRERELSLKSPKSSTVSDKTRTSMDGDALKSPMDSSSSGNTGTTTDPNALESPKSSTASLNTQIIKSPKATTSTKPPNLRASTPIPERQLTVFNLDSMMNYHDNDPANEAFMRCVDHSSVSGPPSIAYPSSSGDSSSTYYFMNGTHLIRHHRQMLVELIMQNKLDDTLSFDGLLPDMEKRYCLFEMDTDILDRNRVFIRTELERSIVLQTLVEMHLDEIYGENVGADIYGRTRGFILGLTYMYDNTRPIGETKLHEYPAFVDARLVLKGVSAVRPGPLISDITDPTKRHAKPLITSQSPFRRSPATSYAGSDVSSSSDISGRRNNMQTAVTTTGGSKYLDIPVTFSGSCSPRRPVSPGDLERRRSDSRLLITDDLHDAPVTPKSTRSTSQQQRETGPSYEEERFTEQYSPSRTHEKQSPVPNISLQPPTPSSRVSRRVEYADGIFHRLNETLSAPLGSLNIDDLDLPDPPATPAKDIPTLAQLVRSGAHRSPTVQISPPPPPVLQKDNFVRPQSAVSQYMAERRTPGRHRDVTPSAVDTELTTAGTRITHSRGPTSRWSPSPSPPSRSPSPTLSSPPTKIPAPTKGSRYFSPRQSSLSTISEKSADSSSSPTPTMGKKQSMVSLRGFLASTPPNWMNDDSSENVPTKVPTSKADKRKTMMISPSRPNTKNNRRMSLNFSPGGSKQTASPTPASKPIIEKKKASSNVNTDKDTTRVANPTKKSPPIKKSPVADSTTPSKKGLSRSTSMHVSPTVKFKDFAGDPPTGGSLRFKENRRASVAEGSRSASSRSNYFGYISTQRGGATPEKEKEKHEEPKANASPATPDTKKRSRFSLPQHWMR